MHATKKIALIGPAYPMRGGIVHYTTLLSRELSKNNALLHLSFKRAYPGWLYPGKSTFEPGVRLIKAIKDDPLIDALSPFTWAMAIRRLRQFQPQMIIFQWWVAFWAPLYLFLLSVLRNTPLMPEIVCICHNSAEHEDNIIKKAATKLVLSKAHRLITHSAEESRKLKTMLPPGVSINTGFHPTYREIGVPGPGKDIAKKRLGIEGSVLLFFGFVRKYKGLDILLDALASIKKKKNVTLLIVGEFWHNKRLYQSQIEKLVLGNQVRIIDQYVPNEMVGLYFASADLVVQPYLSASGSGVCQLAFGHNRPVIATRVGSFPETVKDRINGRVVSPGDAQALATAIIESLEPEQLKLLSENASVAKENFSWSRLAEMILGSGIENRQGPI